MVRRFIRNEIFSLLGYYGPSSGNSILTFRDNVSVPFFVLLIPLDP
jgi:hypothetical protein